MVRQSRPPRLILTRPLEQAKRFAKQASLGLEVVYAPLLQIEMLGVGNINDYDSVIVTSENGAQSLKGANWGGETVYCVGPRTSKSIAELGVVTTEFGGDAASLIDGLIEANPKGRLLHLRGRHGRGDISKTLREAGVDCDERIAYEQHALKFPPDLAKQLAEGAVDLLPLFSPRSAKLFVASCPSAPSAGVVCLSDAVAAELPKNAFGSIEICASPNGDAMREALSRRATMLRLEGHPRSS